MVFRVERPDNFYRCSFDLDNQWGCMAVGSICAQRFSARCRQAYDDVRSTLNRDHLLIRWHFHAKQRVSRCAQEGTVDSPGPRSLVTLYYTARDSERRRSDEAIVSCPVYRRDALPQARYYRRSRPLEVIDGKPVPLGLQ